MDKRELTREERWEWLKKTTWGKGQIPWDRMVLPHHEWMDAVWISDSYDPETFEKLNDMGFVCVPRYEEDLTQEMLEHLNLMKQYREEHKIETMKKALKWWKSLPLQDIYESKNGWANLVMKYYPEKTDCQDVTNEEVQHMYKHEYTP